MFPAETKHTEQVLFKRTKLCRKSKSRIAASAHCAFPRNAMTQLRQTADECATESRKHEISKSELVCRQLRLILDEPKPLSVF